MIISSAISVFATQEQPFIFFCFLVDSYSNAGVKTALLEAHSEMGSTEILEKETSGSLSNGTSSNVEAAKRLAKRLYQLDRFKRSDVAKHLGKKYVPSPSCCLSVPCRGVFVL